MTNSLNNIAIAPLLSSSTTLVLYRKCGTEIVIKINKKNKTMLAERKLTEIEIEFIKENYL